MRHPWRDHLETVLGAIAFATVCVLERRQPVTVMVALGALSALGAAVVLAVVRWVLRRMWG
jgi:hypothetical protein